MKPDQREAPPHPNCPFCNAAPRYLPYKSGFYEEKVICDACGFSLAPALWSRRAQVEALTVPQWKPVSLSDAEVREMDDEIMESPRGFVLQLARRVEAHILGAAIPPFCDEDDDCKECGNPFANTKRTVTAKMAAAGVRAVYQHYFGDKEPSSHTWDIGISSAMAVKIYRAMNDASDPVETIEDAYSRGYDDGSRSREITFEIAAPTIPSIPGTKEGA